MPPAHDKWSHFHEWWVCETSVMPYKDILEKIPLALEMTQHSVAARENRLENQKHQYFQDLCVSLGTAIPIRSDSYS